jgi:hypothetical protein
VFEEDSDPVLLREGDLFLLVNPPAYRLAGSLDAEPSRAQTVWESVGNGRASIGAEAAADFGLCGGQFWFDQANAAMLIDVLPRPRSSSFMCCVPTSTRPTTPGAGSER